MEKEGNTPEYLWLGDKVQTYSNGHFPEMEEIVWRCKRRGCAPPFLNHPNANGKILQNTVCNNHITIQQITKSYCMKTEMSAADKKKRRPLICTKIHPQRLKAARNRQK